jgi:NAD dependent epimerase/dehydratase family enzyme
VTNKEFVKTIGKVLHRPVFLPPVPKFALKLFLGEMSGIVTEGSRVSNEKLLKTGFVFEHNKLSEALTDLLK